MVAGSVVVSKEDRVLAIWSDKVTAISEQKVEPRSLSNCLSKNKMQSSIFYSSYR